MKFGIIAGILAQAFSGLLLMFSIQSKGISEEIGILGLCGLLGFVLMLFFGSMRKV